MTYEGIHSATSSPVSEDGASPSASRPGLTSATSGPPPFHASPSVSPVPAEASPTSATSSPCSPSWWERAAPSFSSESSLRAVAASSGSTMYSMTLRVEVLPISKARIVRLVPSVLRTNDAACIGEPGGRLGQWPTVCARDYRHANSRPYSERGGRSKGEQLNNAAKHFPLWEDLDRLPDRGQIPTGSSVETDGVGQLNEELARWLMGYPPEWSELAPTGKPRQCRR